MTVEVLTDNDYTPVLQQKGFRLQIHLDISVITLKHQTNLIILVIGDSDYAPAAKFAYREGRCSSYRIRCGGLCLLTCPNTLTAYVADFSSTDRLMLIPKYRNLSESLGGHKHRSHSMSDRVEMGAVYVNC